MDIYKVIRESKEGKLFDTDELNKLYSFANDQILLNIAAVEDEDSKVGELASIILKNRDNFWTAKYDETLDGFSKDLESEIKSKIKQDRKDVKKDLFDKMDIIAKSTSQKIDNGKESPNTIFFKLFLNEYNTKHAFTWKAFKEAKKRYEKSNPVDGEDIYTLKSMLEKDPKIEKVSDTTVFCKAAHSLSDEIIDKLKEKANG